MGTAANPKPALVLRLACAVLSLTSAISAEQLPIKIYTIADGHFLTTDVTQIARLEAVVQRLGGEVVYVKPHGALYNVAVKNKVVAQAIAQGVARWNPQAPIFGLAGSPMLDVWRGMGMRVVSESFADRRYETDGTLRSRKFPDALITEPQEAAAHTRTATPAVMRRVY
jgi:lactam utilization protein B